MKIIQKVTVLLSSLLLSTQVLAQEADNISKGLAAIGGGLAAMGAAIGIGILAGRLLEAISRQPELEGKLMGRFFLTVGLTDAVPIIAIVLAMIVLFA
jgi:F-type H+-transporting ATPase subunit c